jgi:two-component system, sensor histidine kinase and response regulator
MNVKCLLVDDLDENLLALSALLRQDGVELLTANSATRALELLLEHDIALALLDVQMPEMDGFQLAELMRGAERTRHIPIIFVTAGGRDQVRLFKGYDAGAVDFLYKPIEPRILRNKAEVFFQIHRQRQQLAQELHARSETLRFNEMFIAVLGHDLRNPLHAINLSAEGLQQLSQDTTVKALAARIQSSGRRMQRMIEDLLDLVRVRMSKGIALRCEPTRLDARVERVVQEHRTAAPNRRIEVVMRGDFAGEWDGGRLEQVVSNLVGNALQHGLADEPVRVELDGQAADCVRMTISNGGTIEESVRRNIFEPFVSADGGEHRGGLGLGLYIVDQIVRAHGGSVSVTNRDGARTCFDVQLPRVSQAAG